MKKLIQALLILGFGVFAHAEVPANAKVFFIEPKDHATVPKHFKVKMGVEGMKLCPANTATQDSLCGHHHLIVDGAPIPAGQPIANDPTHLHFGKMQTETDLDLPPGHHTLTLQFADFAHHSYGEKLSKSISVDVK